jgi:SAM-dependent methyltransferase
MVSAGLGGYDDDDVLLAEQRQFYRQRAPEYDEWWQRRGRYDHGPDEARDWVVQVAVVDGALSDFGATGDVLELAGGTGWWTERLAGTASRLTVVDAAPETLARSRSRVGRSDVVYVVADLFAWRPSRRYDVVFFSFWLSHVPRSRFADFWGRVASALRPDGRVFFIDNRHDPTRIRPDPYVTEQGGDVQQRTLSDGSRHRVVKVLYEADELCGLLSAEGWDANVKATRWFIYGEARRPER